MPSSIPEIAITGGPCGGKTTAMAYLRERLEDMGFRVFVVPEAPTIVITLGVSDISRLRVEEPRKYLEAQRVIFRLHMFLRKETRRLAASFENAIMIDDRGAFDHGSYMEEDEFLSLLAEEGYEPVDLLNSYGAVFHMQSAAVGAPHAYTRENNPARYETVDEAVVNDRKTLEAWLGHLGLKVIPNFPNFDEKLTFLFQEVCRFLGMPVPLATERRFVLSSLPDLSIEGIGKAVTLELEQWYLLSNDGTESRVRKRSQEGKTSYYRTQKFPVAGGTRVETETVLTAGEYEDLKPLRDPGKRVVRKRRSLFTYQGQYFELDVLDGAKPLYLLTVQVTEENDTLALPPFFDVAQDATGDEAFSNYALASL